MVQVVWTPVVIQPIYNWVVNNTFITWLSLLPDYLCTVYVLCMCLDA